MNVVGVAYKFTCLYFGAYVFFAALLGAYVGTWIGLRERK